MKEKTKFLAGLDPRARLLMMALFSTIALLIRDPAFLGLLLPAVLLTLFLGGIAPAQIVRRCRGLLLLIFFLFVTQALFRRSGKPLLVIGGFPAVFTEGLILAGMLTLRLLIIVLAAQILLEGEMRDYLLALIQMRIPYEIAFMVMTGLHFLPVLREEALNVWYSVQLRGTELKRVPFYRKPGLYRRICLPILAAALHRASELSVAMEARGLRACPQRTSLRRLQLSAADVGVMIGYGILITGLFVWWHFRTGS